MSSKFLFSFLSQIYGSLHPKKMKAEQQLHEMFENRVFLLSVYFEGLLRKRKSASFLSEQNANSGLDNNSQLAGSSYARKYPKSAEVSKKLSFCLVFVHFRLCSYETTYAFFQRSANCPYFFSFNSVDVNTCQKFEKWQ